MVRNLKLQKKTDKKPESWNPEQVLAEALAERTIFLEKNPKYKKYQQEISTLLDKAGTPEKRMTVLAILMETKLIEMHQQLKHLNEILVRVGNRYRVHS
jgi:bacterioferritin (cytochrome b1)